VSRAGTPSPVAPDVDAEGRSAAPAPGAPGDERWHLRDEREFLWRSLADADLEHQAGDLSDADHDALRRRDEARLSDVDAALARLDDVAAAPSAAVPAAADGTAPRRRRSRRSTVFAVIGCVSLLAGALALVMALTSPRLPGQAATGGISLNTQQLVARQLAQADELAGEGQVAQAVTLYRTVLAESPNRPEALAQLGWLYYRYGRGSSAASDGRLLVARAVALDPSYGPAYLYLGEIDLHAGNDPTAAAGAFQRFLADDPSPAALDDFAADIARADTAAGRPVPGVVVRAEHGSAAAG
jgi:cytochrome c-type biogenesis protein CcmH/NrfG